MDTQNPQKGNAKSVIIGVLVTVIVIGGAAAAIYGGNAGWFSGMLTKVVPTTSTKDLKVQPKVNEITTKPSTIVTTNIPLTLKDIPTTTVTTTGHTNVVTGISPQNQEQVTTTTTTTTTNTASSVAPQFFLQSEYPSNPVIHLFNSTDIHPGEDTPVYGFRLKSLNYNTTTFINNFKFKFSGCLGDSYLKPKSNITIHAFDEAGIHYTYKDFNRDGVFDLIEGSNQLSNKPSLADQKYMDFFIKAESTAGYCNAGDTVNVDFYEFIWQVEGGNPVTETNFNKNTNANANTVRFQ